MQLNLGNVATGQFFTPYHVSKMMSEISFIDIEKQLEEKDFITLSEPCCGSGGMIIAYAETFKEHGYNYQYQLFVEAIDIDEMCFMMTYIQLSLLGVGAKVILGDSLTLDLHKILYTPFYFVNGFGLKLKKQNKASNNELPQNVNNKQLTLFNF